MGLMLFNPEMIEFSNKYDGQADKYVNMWNTNIEQIQQ